MCIRDRLYLLPPGAQIPAEFTGGAIFSEAPGCADARILQPAQSAAPDAAGVWADTQVSGGSLEGYARALLARWGERLWMYLRPDVYKRQVCIVGTVVMLSLK